MYHGLWYPITIAAMTFVIGLIFVRETKDVDIYVIGILVLLGQYFGVGPLATWTWADDWLLMLLPFALAIAWWTWCDATGYTRKKAMQRDDERRDARRQKAIDALGLNRDKRK
jgi:small Trp-rich protein